MAVAAGNGHTVGLTASGRVMAVGGNDDGECDASGWREVVAVAAGARHTLALQSDGRVVATGSNVHGQCDIDRWRVVRNPF